MRIRADLFQAVCIYLAIIAAMIYIWETFG